MPRLVQNQILQEGTNMFKTKNSVKPQDSTMDPLKWLGKLLLTIAAGIIINRYGVRLPNSFKF
jgi:hypothetical protein